MRKYERDLRKQIDGLGLQHGGLQRMNNGHYSLEVTAGRAKRKFVFAFSPSDNRGLMNNLSTIRNWVRMQEINS